MNALNNNENGAGERVPGHRVGDSVPHLSVYFVIMALIGGVQAVICCIDEQRRP